MSVGKCDSSLRTFKDLGTEVMPNVTLDIISKIHFIPRKFIPKSKITLDHARKCLIPVACWPHLPSPPKITKNNTTFFFKLVYFYIKRILKKMLKHNLFF